MIHTQHTDGSVEYTPYEELLPIPEEPATPAAAELREQAYRAEADQYLIAYMGYLAEGRTAEAEAQKALYLARKAETRTEYPDKPEPR